MKAVKLSLPAFLVTLLAAAAESCPVDPKIVAAIERLL